MTQYGICNLSLIPLRAEPSHRSEMTSQILFGDCFEILDEQKSWSLIRLAHDNYEGWVDTKQVTSINFELYKEITHHTQAISDLSSHGILMRLGHDEMLHILPGSTLPLLQEDGLFTIDETDYMFLGLSINPDARNIIKEIEEVSRFYINTPYLWGGRSMFGIDCSGFTQMVYKHFGIKIPRDASQQVGEGKTIDFLQKSLPGDLAFFDGEDGKIIHVGILLNDSEIIHSSGKVKVDKIDENGIFSLEDQKYTHNLRIIKRIVHY